MNTDFTIFERNYEYPERVHRKGNPEWPDTPSSTTKPRGHRGEARERTCSLTDLRNLQMN